MNIPKKLGEVTEAQWQDFQRAMHPLRRNYTEKMVALMVAHFGEPVIFGDHPMKSALYFEAMAYDDLVVSILDAQEKSRARRKRGNNV